MKRFGSLIFGAVASFVAATTAQAADLPAKTAQAVDWVRICTAYGNGFFYLPGTETCLRVGGRARAEIMYAEPLTRLNDTIGFRTRGRIQLDARTATAYGLVRAFLRFEITRVAGLPYNQAGTVNTSIGTGQAFVQFGGLTAGRVTSMFSSPDLPNTHMGTLRFDDAPDVDLLAYTYSFGNGFSATLSLEEGFGRRQNNSFTPIVGQAVLNFGGETVPDIVGNLRYVGTWGTAQLSAVAHQVRSANVLTTVIPGTGVIPDTEWGWAVGFQGSVNLPMIAEGDAAWLSLGYADAALGYIGFGSDLLNVFGAGLISTPAVDAWVDTVAGKLKRGRGFSVAGGFNHYWTPQWRTSIFGSFARVDFSGHSTGIGPFGNVTGIPDFREWRIGTNTFWFPVSGLAIGAELMYVIAQTDGKILALQPRASGEFAPRLIDRDTSLQARFRIQRDF
ncbi:porin [Microvirga terricola]|uniref:Porin n=1 Tax=Microvirga terricola TaxID=2719797 RepID=A0ABX0VF11_9HYPH|nr:porin [Microvirga terricola]NIX77766.1 porin [Microvirga terricola]